MAKPKATKMKMEKAMVCPPVKGKVKTRPNTRGRRSN